MLVYFAKIVRATEHSLLGQDMDSIIRFPFSRLLSTAKYLKGRVCSAEFETVSFEFYVTFAFFTVLTSLTILVFRFLTMTAASLCLGQDCTHQLGNLR